MKTVFETVHEDSDFCVEIMNKEDQTLAFKSIEQDIEALNFFFFVLSKKEALSLVSHILKIYSE